MAMKIRYADSKEGWSNSFAYVEQLILSNGLRRILEIGGGANPTVSLEFVERHGLEYTVLDISQDELDKAPPGYLTVCADISSNDLALRGGYDLVFSKMLAEHVKSGEVFHRNVYGLLAPKGWAFHFFPTLYAPPFIVNRWLPERLAEKVLGLMQSGREKEGRHAKFPAYYSWCRGPISAQVDQFRSLGYRVSEYIGFFGHDGYYSKFPLILKMHRFLSGWLVRHPMPVLCSFAYVLLQKDSDD